MSDAAVLGLIAAIGSFTTLWFQAWNEGRKRKWAEEDRKRAEKQAEKQAGLIKEVGVHAQAAYNEANHVNLKLAEMASKGNGQITNIEDTVVETKALVEDLQPSK